MKQFAVGALLLTLALLVLLGASLLVVTPDRPEATPALGTLADPDEVFDPVRAGDPLPPGFRQLLPRDGILPVYDPLFVPAADAGWHEGALVIGLEIDGESRAYPVGFLNRREMVIDSVAGIPVLVTW